MDLGLFGFAFGAGALATVNPCGFVMLPALVALQLQQVDTGSVAAHSSPVIRGLLFGGRVTAGFLLVFGALGLVLGLGARSIAQAFPYGGFIIGLALLAFGLWSLLGRRALPVPAWARPSFGRPTRGGLAFGVAYAIASLSCTLPVFLAVVGGTLLLDGLAAAIVPFAGYALGMGAVLIAVTMATALSAGAATSFLRKVMPYVERTGSLLLIGIGAYLVLKWLPVITSAKV